MSTNTAQLITTSTDLKHLNGTQVEIVRVLTEDNAPAKEYDSEALPMVEVRDAQGKRQSLFPEEVRTTDLAPCPSQIEDPIILVGSNPIHNLHPLVEAAFREMSEVATED